MEVSLASLGGWLLKIWEEHQGRNSGRRITIKIDGKTISVDRAEDLKEAVKAAHELASSGTDVRIFINEAT